MYNANGIKECRESFLKSITKGGFPQLQDFTLKPRL